MQLIWLIIQIQFCHVIKIYRIIFSIQYLVKTNFNEKYNFFHKLNNLSKILYIMLSFDQLLTSRIGLGKYQYIQSFQIAMMNFISGMQIIGISIFTRVFYI